MKCYVCGNRLNGEDYCASCGTDVRMYRHIMCMSNKLYNDGLEKANVRDLSGAIISLQESLKYNKRNIDARNLLGLCYFERGEAVLALSEWIISKNYESKKNMADTYIDELSSNPTQLDTIGQTIKKYNQALNYCYQNSQDLAIIQLKKVLSINKNLISGYQLLALLYIEQEDYEKARRTLLRAIRIDTNDTTTQRYLKEINTIITERAESKNTGGKDTKNPTAGMQAQDIITYQNGTETIIQPVGQKERRGFSSIINIVIGLVLGLAICWYLILPSRLEKESSENDEKFIAVSEELATEKASHQESLKQIETDFDTISELQRQIDELTGAKGIVTENDYLLDAAQKYIADKDDSEAVMDNLVKISDDFIAESSNEFKTLYNTLMTLSSNDAIEKYRDIARSALKRKDYDESIEYYTKVWELDMTNSDNLMALAYVYRESGDTDKADELYRKVMSDFSETDNAMDAAEYLTSQNEEQ